MNSTPPQHPTPIQSSAMARLAGAFGPLSFVDRAASNQPINASAFPKAA
ncbi:MAG: hypothetical protein ACN4GZ_01005 [Acidimicrobiales bacterium]